jgi:hypothetical protein
MPLKWIRINGKHLQDCTNYELKGKKKQLESKLDDDKSIHLRIELDAINEEIQKRAI